MNKLGIKYYRCEIDAKGPLGIGCHEYFKSSEEKPECPNCHQKETVYLSKG